MMMLERVYPRRTPKALSTFFKRHYSFAFTSCASVMIIIISTVLKINSMHLYVRNPVKFKAPFSTIPAQCPAWDALYQLNLSSLLDNLGILSIHESCFAKLLWNGSKFLYTGSEFEVICKANREKIQLRFELYVNLLSTIFMENGFRSKFCGIIDLSDATRNYRDLYKALPDLLFFSFAKGEEDSRSILLPDPHLILAIAWLENQHGIIPESMRGFARSISQLYNSSHFANSENKDWGLKKDKMVYRGSCHPTVDPESSINIRINKRARFCATMHENSSLIDFSIRCATGKGHAGDCSKCCDKGSFLSPDAMATSFRYQLAIDGHGPSYDATIWKFLSRSTVFLGNPVDTEKKSLSLFYYSLLKENEDYLLTNEENWKTKIIFCNSNQHICKQIAENGYEKIKRILSWKYILTYVMKVIFPDVQSRCCTRNTLDALGKTMSQWLYI